MVMVTRHQFGLEASKCFSHKVPFYDVTQKNDITICFQKPKKGIYWWKCRLDITSAILEMDTLPFLPNFSDLKF